MARPLTGSPLFFHPPVSWWGKTSERPKKYETRATWRHKKKRGGSGRDDDGWRPNRHNGSSGGRPSERFQSSTHESHASLSGCPSGSKEASAIYWKEIYFSFFCTAGPSFRHELTRNNSGSVFLPVKVSTSPFRSRVTMFWADVIFKPVINFRDWPFVLFSTPVINIRFHYDARQKGIALLCENVKRRKTFRPQMVPRFLNGWSDMWLSANQNRAVDFYIFISSFFHLDQLKF